MSTNGDTATGTEEPTNTVRTNTQRERIEGVEADVADLEVGDHVYVEYREPRDAGGLAYTPNEMSIVGEVTIREGDAVVVEPDFADETEVVLRPEGALESYPTVQFTDGIYGVKSMLKRTDVTPERRRNVAFYNVVANRDIRTEYGDMAGGAHTVTVYPETAEEYRAVRDLIDHIQSGFDADADVTVTWYESEDDLQGERGWKSAGEVEDHDSVTVGVDW